MNRRRRTRPITGRRSCASSSGAVTRALALAVAVAAAPVFAPGAARADTFQPGAWKAGEWSITPQLASAAGWNDNLRAQSLFTVASPFVALTPALDATRTAGEDRYEIAWRAEWTRFTRSHPDDTLDTEAAFSGLNLVDAQTAVAWRAGWQEGHDALGLQFPDQPAQSPDHYRALAVGAIWRHDLGADGGDATRRIELEPTVSYKHYVNHREVTAGADADTGSLVGRWLAMRDARHRAGGELRMVRTIYPTDTGVLTNVDWRALAVLQSDPRPADAPPDPTARGGDVSGGAASLGWQHRQFAHFRPAWDGLVWDAAWQWAAPAGTTWAVSTQRSAIDAPGEAADEAVVMRMAFTVARDWGASWHTTLSASHTRDRFVHATFARDDVVRAVDLGVRHDLSRTWQVALNLGWSHRDSQVWLLDYTRHLASLVVTAAI